MAHSCCWTTSHWRSIPCLDSRCAAPVAIPNIPPLRRHTNGLLIVMCLFNGYKCNVQGVTAIALDTAAGLQSRLAVAVRTSKRSVRVLVYEVVPGVGLGTQMHSQPAICLTQAELSEPLIVKVRARIQLEES